MKKKLLITSVGGIVGQGALRALKGMRGKLALTGMDMDRFNYGAELCDEFYKSPPVVSSKYVAWLENIAARKKINAILITHGCEMELFNRIRERFESKFNVKILLSDKKTVETGVDKWKTYLFLRENGFTVPETMLYNGKKSGIDAEKHIGFPLIAKPVKGYGSQGIYVLRNRRELNSFATMELKGYIIQKHIGNEGNEFTVGTFTSKFTGETYLIVFRRKIKNGSTVYVEICRDKRIELLSEKVIKKLGASGPINIQIRRQNNVPYIFEINPKLSGTTSLRAAFGFNDARMLIEEELFNIPARRPEISSSGKAVRFFSDFVAIRNKKFIF